MRSTSHGVRSILAGLAAAAALGVVIGPAAAATPQAVTIVAHMSKQGYGTFEASGDAVDGGLVCERGTVLDTDAVVGGYQSGQKVQVQSRKALTCTDERWVPDGSGTFFVKIQIHVVFGGDEPFRWVIQGGTGDYAGLQGSGVGVTADNTDVSNTNIYDGFVTP
jgi:hypothetical protein